MKYALLSTILTLALAMSVFGQSVRTLKAKTVSKTPELSGMMGKPTVDGVAEGVHIKVWVVTHKQYAKLMKGKMGKMMMQGEEGSNVGGMKDGSMKSDMDRKEALIPSTHHLMVNVIDGATGKELTASSAKVLIISPSMKNSSVDLHPMKNNFGCGLTLDEKGDYQLTVNVLVNGVTETKQFPFKVK